MMKKLNLKDWRMMLLVGVAVGALAAAPLGAHALNEQGDDQSTQTTADTDTSSDTPDQTQPTDPAADTTPTDTTPTDDTSSDPTTTPVEQTTDPSDESQQPGETDTTTSPTVADLQSAITIASAEHPNVQAVSAKLKLLNGNKVYKVVFADGWIAYVSADNGSVLLLQNNDGQKQPCHNYARAAWLKHHKNWKPFTADYFTYSRAWVTKQNWPAAKHNWQPQQSTTNTPSSDDTTAAATRTTQNSSAKASVNKHVKTSFHKH